MCNAVVTMVRVAAPVAIEVVTHVNELFSDHNLDGARLRAIDPIQVDEDNVAPCSRKAAIGAAPDRQRRPSRPLAKRFSACRQHQCIGRQAQQGDIG